jgi:hypothetical protein
MAPAVILRLRAGHPADLPGRSLLILGKQKRASSSRIHSSKTAFSSIKSRRVFNWVDLG